MALSRILEEYVETVTVSGGTGTYTSPSIEGILITLIAVPTTLTDDHEAKTDKTVFDLEVTDRNSIKIYPETDDPEAISYSGRLVHNGLRIPMIGVHTFTFSNVNNDEDITLKFVLEK